MTREQVEARWAGMTPRERDAWVAERVMGLQGVRKGKGHYAGWEYVFIDRMDNTNQPVPRFTTNNGAAWQVVEEFDYLYLYKPDRPIVDQIPVGHYECKLVRLDDSRMYYAVAATASEAICLAAILALEVV